MGKKKTSSIIHGDVEQRRVESDSESEVFLSERTDGSENCTHPTAQSDPSSVLTESDQTAATVLLRFHESATHNQAEQMTDKCSVTGVPTVPSIFQNSGLSASCGSNETPMSSAQSGEGAIMPQALTYSEANIRNTVSGLSHALTHMQQQQLGMQQQQASMQLKQDTISGALSNVLSILQELSKNTQNSSQNNSSGTEHTERSETTSEPNQSNEQGVSSLMNRAGGDQVNSRRQYEGHMASNFACGNVIPDDRRVLGNGLSISSQNGSCNLVSNGRQERYGTHQSRFVDQNAATSCSLEQSRSELLPQMQNTIQENMQRVNNAERPQYSSFSNEVKLPPFKGKEDWKVWVNRFEAVAERKGWSDETKLDNLLPKLEGKAGEFVFTQLPHQTLTSYKDLVKELNSRFRIVETRKTYAAKFSQRVQRQGETAEEFAAELKRLYAKAYKFRDQKTRQEDLVRRFLDGLRDSDARFEIEYNKEPDDIDEAVFHAVNFVQTRHRSSSERSADRKFKKYARRASQESESSSDGESEDESKQKERAYRIPATKETVQTVKTDRKMQTNASSDSKHPSESESLKVLSEAKDMMQTLISQMQEFSKTSGNFTVRQQENKSNKGRNIICFGCSQLGHVVRECPQRNNKTIYRNPVRPNGFQRGPVQNIPENKPARQNLN